MTEQEVKLKMCAELSKIYGIEEGIRMAGTVVPGILNDFRKMLSEGTPGKPVREEYRLEDGRARVYLSGEKKKNGAYEILTAVVK